MGASDVDPGSNRSVIDQIFGPRIKRMNNSEYFEDSPVMKFFELMYNGVAVGIGCYIGVMGMHSFFELIAQRIKRTQKK